ncbi:hypothetical protein ACS0TY_016711 [Phlomoides rotata]
MLKQPSVLAFNELLSLIIQLKEYSAALYVFDELRQLGLAINHCAMNTINYCCRFLNWVHFEFVMLGSFSKQYYIGVATISIRLQWLCLVVSFCKSRTWKLCELNEVLFVINGLLQRHMAQCGKSLSVLCCVFVNFVLCFC